MSRDAECICQIWSLYVHLLRTYEKRQKSRRLSDLGRLGITKVMGNLRIWSSVYNFLFNFNRNYVSILYHFQYKVSHLSQVADLSLPHLHLAPLSGVTLVKFCGQFWRRKTRVPGLLCGTIKCLPVLVEVQLVTDRQTDTGP